MKEILPSKGCNVNSGKDLGIKPPTITKGAENTQRGVEGLIDWFEFTLPVLGQEGVKVMMDLLKIPEADWIEAPKAALGYKSRLMCGDISIFYDGKSNMGTHVCMKGQGCRQYEAHFGDRWVELIESIFSLKGGFSRLDVALDDYRGRITLKHIIDKVLKHEVRTLFGRTRADGSSRPFRVSIEPDYNSAPGVNDGLVVHAGSCESKVLIRFYDKAVQMGVNYPWVRSEIQCRDKRADKLAMEIIGGELEGKGFGKVAAGVFRTYVNFVEPSGTDTNKARWAVSPWWSEFLGCVERVRLTIKAVVKTIQDKVEWTEKQWAKTAAMISAWRKSKGYDPDEWMRRLALNGRKLLKPADYAVLQAAGVPV